MPILKDFSCVFEAGKTTALVGPSGSGKSTIIQMIERFYNPTSGKIRVDNIGIEKLNLKFSIKCFIFIYLPVPMIHSLAY